MTRFRRIAHTTVHGMEAGKRDLAVHNSDRSNARDYLARCDASFNAYAHKIMFSGCRWVRHA